MKISLEADSASAVHEKPHVTWKVFIISPHFSRFYRPKNIG